MIETSISPKDPFDRKRIKVLDSEIAFVDTGEGDPIVFLHGNPTSSYLWRNVIPHLEDVGHCLAPDLIGMGDSGKNPAGEYRYKDHVRYLDAWFDALELKNVILVLHDWGSGLGFHWAHRNPERVQGIAYMEALVQAISWEDWPESSRELFQAFHTPAGEKLILEKNIFVERILPGSVLREMSEEEMDAYRKPYLDGGESRRPMLTWPREIPVREEGGETVEIVDGYAEWISTSDVPKLFINAEPGAILLGKPREFCRTWPNQQEVTVKGSHFIQEDSPHEIGKAVREFVMGLRS